MGDFEIRSAGVALAGAEAGSGIPVVLLHGLTATRRYVVMGSRALERSGHRVIGFDARGHGDSSPALDAAAYAYGDLIGDLGAVMDERDVARAVLAGASMGAHTLLGYALRRPERVAGLVVITPAYEPGVEQDAERLARWDALAQGLRHGGVEGFVEAYGPPAVPEALQPTVLKVIRQRLALHQHPEAVADALRAVPRSRPFQRWEDLAQLRVPTAVIGSDDLSDPGHPLRVAEMYAETIPGARLVRDEPGRSPVAWQGSQVSAVIADVAAAAEFG